MPRQTNKPTLGLHHGGAFSASNGSISKPFQKPKEKKTSKIPNEVLKLFDSSNPNSGGFINEGTGRGMFDKVIPLNESVVPASEDDTVSYLSLTYISCRLSLLYLFLDY